MEHTLRERSRQGSALVLYGVVTNATLAVIKVLGGVWGHSNALLADGLESSLDVVSSVLIWGALLYAGKPPDAEHPYGHGKLESLAAVVGAIFLLGAGTSVAVHSGMDLWAMHENRSSMPMPQAWTLIVLAVAIAAKEVLFRILMQAGRRIGSTAMQADAWHHRSDVITSLAAFFGISIALVGGSKWQGADNWAALFSCAIILRNGLGMLRQGVGEVIDEQVSPALAGQILEIACAVPDVSSAEKCRVRKSGLTLIADLHVRVPGHLTVYRGHEISHEVKDRLMDAGLHLSDVTVHLEPDAAPGEADEEE
jgi:cation diffusion facilitator family transporter